MRILTSVNNSKISSFSLFAMLYISRLVVSLTHVQSIMAGKLSTQMLMSVGVALVLSLLFALLFLLTFGVPMFAAFHTQGSSDLVSLLHSAVLTAPIL